MWPHGALARVVAAARVLLRAVRGSREVAGGCGVCSCSCFAGGRARSLERRRGHERGERSGGEPITASVSEGDDQLAAAVAGDDQMVVVEE